MMTIYSRGIECRRKERIQNDLPEKVILKRRPKGKLGIIDLKGLEREKETELKQTRKQETAREQEKIMVESCRWEAEVSHAQS